LQPHPVCRLLLTVISGLFLWTCRNGSYLPCFVDMSTSFHHLYNMCCYTRTVGKGRGIRIDGRVTESECLCDWTNGEFGEWGCLRSGQRRGALCGAYSLPLVSASAAGTEACTCLLALSRAVCLRRAVCLLSKYKREIFCVLCTSSIKSQ
jgi:hypothetical protein